MRTVPSIRRARGRGQAGSVPARLEPVLAARVGEALSGAVVAGERRAEGESCDGRRAIEGGDHLRPFLGLGVGRERAALSNGSGWRGPRTSTVTPCGVQRRSALYTSSGLHLFRAASDGSMAYVPFGAWGR